MNGFRYLHQAYTATDPHYTGKVTVPTLWDKQDPTDRQQRVLRHHPHAQQRIRRHRRRRCRLLPASRCAPRSIASTTSSTPTSTTASTAAASPSRRPPTRQAYDALFATLDELEARLSTPALPARTPDHRGRLAAVPDSGPLRCRLFLAVSSATRSASPTTRTSRTTCASSTQLPGIAETVKARYYVINYWSIARLNPLGIIPKGTPVDYTQPHDRARLANPGPRPEGAQP